MCANIDHNSLTFLGEMGAHSIHAPKPCLHCCLQWLVYQPLLRWRLRNIPELPGAVLVLGHLPVLTEDITLFINRVHNSSHLALKPMFKVCS